MVGSEMDGDRLLDVLGGRSSASRHSPAKRQQMMGSSSSPPLLAPSDTNNCGGTGDQEGDAGTTVLKLKKKVRASRMQSGENNPAGEGDTLRSLPAATGTSVTARRSIQLSGKVVEDEDSADPAPVPRKLRSAINKRSGQSASPPLPNVKKKRQHVCNGIQLHDTITEDEKEVIEALCALSGTHSTCQIHVEKQGRMISAGNPNGDVISSSLPEVLKGDGSPLECDASPNEETVKGKCAELEKTVTSSGSKASELDVNKIPNPDHDIPIVSCKSDSTVGIPRNIVNDSASLGVSPNYYSGNGLLQPSHNVALHMDSPGSVAMHHDVHTVSDKRELGRKPVGQNETAPHMPILPSIVNEHQKLSSSSCTAVWPGAPAIDTRPSLMQTDLPIEFPLMPFVATRSGRNCAVHICISHLIKRYQEKEKEKQKLLSFPSEDMKSEEVPKSGEISGSEMPKMRTDLSSMTTTGANCQLVEMNTNQLRSDMLRNGRYIYSQQASLSESHAGRKQAYQFLSLSTGTEASNSGSNTMTSGQLDAPFIQPQFSQHSIVPFPFSHVPYTTPYAEQLPAPASQPVQLRPHYIGNPLYGLQTSSCSDASRLQQQQYQQQQMWQAHLAPGYRQPMSIRMSQNPHLHDPNLSWSLNPQHSFCINPFRRDS